MGNTPQELVIDIGAGGWTDKRSDNCAAVAGEYTLTYNEERSTDLANHICYWDYYDEAFGNDSDPDCTDTWRLFITFRLAFAGGDDCLHAVIIAVACNKIAVNWDPPFVNCNDDMTGCSTMGTSIQWNSTIITIDKADVACGTADWPLSLVVNTPRDDCERNLLSDFCPCWNQLPSPLSLAEV